MLSGLRTSGEVISFAAIGATSAAGTSRAADTVPASLTPPRWYATTSTVTQTACSARENSPSATTARAAEGSSRRRLVRLVRRSRRSRLGLTLGMAMTMRRSPRPDIGSSPHWECSVGVGAGRRPQPVNGGSSRCGRASADARSMHTPIPHSPRCTPNPEEPSCPPPPPASPTPTDPTDPTNLTVVPTGGGHDHADTATATSRRGRPHLVVIRGGRADLPRPFVVAPPDLLRLTDPGGAQVRADEADLVRCRPSRHRLALSTPAAHWAPARRTSLRSPRPPGTPRPERRRTGRWTVRGRATRPAGSIGADRGRHVAT